MNKTKHVLLFDTAEEASKKVAKKIALQIKQSNAQNKPYILGLATGATPIMLYKELILLHKEDNLSFKNVITFNLDEYYPIDKDDSQSYFYFMYNNFFNHIDISKENINIPSGMIPEGDRASFCSDYDNKIEKLGGLDFQVLGIGRTGHIGFNEPGSEIDSSTRVVSLAEITIQDAIKDFGSIDLVPREAITMGVKTILNAKEIALLAFGENKSHILKEAIDGEITSNVPASFLQNHPKAFYYLDNLSSQLLNIK